MRALEKNKRKQFRICVVVKKKGHRIPCELTVIAFSGKFQIHF